MATQDAAAVVEHAMRLYGEKRLDELRALVHPEAEIQMLFLGGEIARGPDGLTSALHKAASSIHVPTGTRVERIDEQAAILVGRILHEAPRGGLSDHSAAWLNITRDGLMWRVLVFSDAAEARRAYETGFRTDASDQTTSPKGRDKGTDRSIGPSPISA